MPPPTVLLLLATLLPLASFATLLFAGKRIGNPLAGWLATIAIAASFVCSLLALFFWLQTGWMPSRMPWGYGKNPICLIAAWLPVGGGIAQASAGYLDVGLYVDSLTLVMFLMVTLVATLVHLFSIGYMREDPRFARFFTYLGLFCFSMLGLLLAATLLQLFIFWELVGLCSYLLIGFWHENRSAANAATMAFITNRIGDIGFIIGFGILFLHLGNLTLPHLWTLLQAAGSGAAITLPDGGGFSPALLTITGICLFFGAVGKSAQFPLHVWLPSAMEGPTPVSALIHAATMVAAGVYLMARLFPILTPDAKLYIAITGVITLTLGALIALAQTDIKRVLAYSTISQLGYMLLAIGVGCWVGALFHLITHAFFKSLLFLGAGSVIHAAEHEQEMAEYGGLMRQTPATAITFGVAVLAISGVPFLSGYYSKEMILTHAGAFAMYATTLHRQSTLYRFLFIIPMIVAALTAFYMARCWMLTFWGRPRNLRLYEQARETPIMWMPLLLLAILSIFGGSALGIGELLERSIDESVHYCTMLQRDIAPRSGGGADAAFVGFATAWPAEVNTDAMGPGISESEGIQEAAEMYTRSWAPWAWGGGLALGCLLYLRGFAAANVFLKVAPIRWVRHWLYNEMYFDELYFAVPVAITAALAAFCAWLDRYVIDAGVELLTRATRALAYLSRLSDRYLVDGFVHGAVEMVQDIGTAARAPQSGRIRFYVTVLMGTLTLLLAAAVLAVALAGR
jgi:proton-translocating NADH-quinone oxidoreductase chain L